MNTQQLSQLAKLIRYYILFVTTTAGSGHVTSSLSAVELMTALMFTQFRADLDHPENPANDRLIFSKGHASPLFYGLYAAAGKITKDELSKYRTFDSPLEGHPTLRFPFTEAPTGSLGQGLSIGVGEAFALRLQLGKDKAPRVYVLLGDGEMAEGSVWEAMNIAAFYKLDNVVGIIDVNRQGQSQETMFGHDVDVYEKRVASFGWHTIVVDGHDLESITAAYESIGINNDGKPTMIIARTLKGYGISSVSDKPNWHGKPLPKDAMEAGVKELGDIDFNLTGEVQKPVSNPSPPSKASTPSNPLTYKLGDKVATRQAIGDALTALMSTYPGVVVIDGDVKNSLYTESAQKAYPDRYFEMYIAEQNMAGTAIGMQRRGLIPWVTTFSAFLSRAYDQIRMAALAEANIKYFGSHAGVSIGEDGASQMGLEDISMFRPLLGSVVLCPSDGNSAAKLVEEMIKYKGIAYIRGGRPNTPVIYGPDEQFPLGGFKVHKLSNPSTSSTPSNPPKTLIIATGVTVPEALKAQADLAKSGTETIVIDAYSIKPLDGDALQALVKEHGIKDIVTVEDHWAEGGLGDAVLNVFAENPTVKIHKLAVTKLPRSGKGAELLDYEGISASSIVKSLQPLK